MKRGFTLIELLVVLVVVAVLAALIAPSVVRAQERAHTTRRVCAMHQVAVALSMYLDDGGKPDISAHIAMDQALNRYTGNATSRLMRRGDKREQLFYYVHPPMPYGKPKSIGVYDQRHWPDRDSPWR